MDLTAEEQRQLLDRVNLIYGALFNNEPSKAKYKTPGETITYPDRQLIRNIDGNTYDAKVIELARAGYPPAIAAIQLQANAGDTESQAIIANLGTTTPTGPAASPAAPTAPATAPPVYLPPATSPSPQKITLITAQGHMADMWSTYPAQLAKKMDPALFYHQPIGNWDANALPLGPPCDAAFNEGVDLLTNRHPTGPFALVGYSQGAIITSRLYMAMADGGPLAHRRDDFVAGVTFGNPMREQGSFVGRDPGGHGIASSRIVGTGPRWRDYADPGDVYSSVSGPSGEDMTAVYDLVMTLNPISLMGEVMKLFTNPAPGLLAAAEAIIQFIQFGATSPMTAAHVQYEWREVEPGITYFDHACRYMSSVGQQVRSQL